MKIKDCYKLEKKKEKAAMYETPRASSHLFPNEEKEEGTF
jgi:hypothetical protein